MIKCGHCKGHHTDTAGVYACSRVRLTPRSSQARRARPKPQEWRQRKPLPLSHPDRPADLYLMAHDREVALKVGVTQRGRVEEHELHGWTLLHQWRFDVGWDAMNTEELILDRWRNLFSQRPKVPHFRMRQGGSSETVHDTRSTRSDTIRFINERHNEQA